MLVVIRPCLAVKGDLWLPHSSNTDLLAGIKTEEGHLWRYAYMAHGAITCSVLHSRNHVVLYRLNPER